MNRFLRVLFWELKTKLSSKNFIFSTLLWPIMFISFIITPAVQYINTNHSIHIGLIDGTQSELFQLFNTQIKHMNSKEFTVNEILPDSIATYYQKLDNKHLYEVNLDSVTDIYLRVKTRRKHLFLVKKRTKDETQEFKSLYSDLQLSRTIKDSLELLINNIDANLEETFIAESKERANKRLISEKMDAYIYLSSDVLRSGKIEYYSLNYTDQKDIDHIKQLVTNALIQYRLKQSKVRESIQKKVLQSVDFQTFQLKEDTHEKSNTYASYIGPIIGFILLFISIFTTSGYLFNSFVSEKFSRVLEFILSTSRKHTIFLAKILGVGIAGLAQISLWAIIFSTIYYLNIFELTSISYITLENLGYFYIYYFLGYFLYATFFAAISVVAQSQQEAHTVHQLIRLLFTLPLLFALVILKDPSAEIVRTFSLVPFLSPAIMIMRIPLSSQLPIDDILLTIYILLGTISVLYFISYRLFRVLSVYYGRRPSFIECIKIIFTGKF